VNLIHGETKIRNRLINNAHNNPKINSNTKSNHLEEFTIQHWYEYFNVVVTEFQKYPF